MQLSTKLSCMVSGHFLVCVVRSLTNKRIKGCQLMLLYCLPPPPADMGSAQRHPIFASAQRETERDIAESLLCVCSGVQHNRGFPGRERKKPLSEAEEGRGAPFFFSLGQFIRVDLDGAVKPYR